MGEIIFILIFIIVLLSIQFLFINISCFVSGIFVICLSILLGVQLHIYYTNKKKIKYEKQQIELEQNKLKEEQQIKNEEEQEKPLSDIEKTKLEIEENAEKKIMQFMEKEKYNFIFNGIVLIGYLSRQYYYAQFEKSNYVGTYVIIFSTTQDDLLYSKNHIYHVSLNTADELDSILYEIKNKYDNTYFPILPFSACTLQEVKDKFEKELLCKSNYKNFKYLDRFEKFNKQKFIKERINMNPNKIDNILVAYINGKAIYTDDENNVYYIEIPEEFAELGSTANDEDLTKIEELSQEEQDIVMAELGIEQ